MANFRQTLTPIVKCLSLGEVSLGSGPFSGDLEVSDHSDREIGVVTEISENFSTCTHLSHNAISYVSPLIAKCDKCRLAYRKMR